MNILWQPVTVLVDCGLNSFERMYNCSIIFQTYLPAPVLLFSGVLCWTSPETIIFWRTNSSSWPAYSDATSSEA